MLHVRLLSLSAAVWLAAAAVGLADETAPTAEGLRFFETAVRPLLVERCVRCHGPKRQRAGLRLDRREGILRGGDSGPPVIPGDAAASLLVKAIRRADASLAMPPDSPLPGREVAVLERWVRMGAPIPADDGLAARQATTSELPWSFRPPVDPSVPSVRDIGWPQSPLDHFTLARLETRGLRPAPPADRRTLLRRATYDLTGLPPTPEEVAAFFDDTAPGAFARVVDRLLASPAYGERWGRHWLDVARYADSNGLDENIAYGNAWRYRDWVIAAFNRDLPYDQFLTDQLAGDLVPVPDETTRRERLAALGFLGLGPKVLAEVDERKMEMDIVDEQIDTVGRAFLGLTLGCARCHDHKFDPITADDYYGLAGVFKSTRTMESFKKIARWHENPLASPEVVARKAEYDRRVAKVGEAIRYRILIAEAKAGAGGAAGKVAEAQFPAAARRELAWLREEAARLGREAPEFPTAMGVCEGAVVDVAVHVRGNHLRLGNVVPRRIPTALAGSAPPTFDSHGSGRLELARWLTRPDHPLTARVLVNRLWRWHFGQGIVRTVDNFGRLGESPADPALLDWLTCRFIEGGWSIKAMHRRIVLSSTYQMASTGDPRAEAADPENRLHARAPVRRLEAEALRDALLAVAGRLERGMKGPCLEVKNRAFLFDHTSLDRTRYDGRRRAIYLPVVRNNVYDAFALFDFPDPAVSTGDRATTTVAPQALFLMNSAWVAAVCADAADALAGEVDDDARIRRLTLRAYGREATDTEASQARTLVADLERALASVEPDPTRHRARAWAGLVQVIVSANEFLYIR